MIEGNKKKFRILALSTALALSLILAGAYLYLIQSKNSPDNKQQSIDIKGNNPGLRKIARAKRSSFPLVNKLKGFESTVDEYIEPEASTVAGSTNSEEQQDSENSSLRGKIIVLDPGHGEPNNPGSTGPTGITENVVTLEIAKQLKSLLEANAATVLLTRDTTATDMDNVKRGEFANSQKADLFLRIHADKAADDQLRGFQVKWFKTESQEVAELFEKHLKDSGRPSLGVYGRFEEALDKAEVPAITVDLAKISNKEDEALLKKRDFLRSTADVLYRATKEFLSVYSN